MEPLPLNAELVPHAHRRMAQRALPLEAVHAALDWGRPFRITRGWGYRLDRRSVRAARRDGVNVSRWEGVVVLTDRRGRVSTAYRNRAGHRLRR